MAQQKINDDAMEHLQLFASVHGVTRAGLLERLIFKLDPQLPFDRLSQLHQDAILEARAIDDERRRRG